MGSTGRDPGGPDGNSAGTWFARSSGRAGGYRLDRAPFGLDRASSERDAAGSSTERAAHGATCAGACG